MMKNFYLALISAILGCSSESSPSGEHSSGGGSGASRGDGGAAGEMGSGGAAATGGSGGGSAPPSAASLFPMAVGNTWSYVFNALSQPSSCSAELEPHERTVLRTETMEGRMAHVVSWPCDPDAVLYVSIVGDEVEQFIVDDWRTTMAMPLQDGHEWQIMEELTFTWQSAGSVTVPAGTFEDCWTRVPAAAGLATFTYCPDVGTVKQGDDTYELLLSSYEIE